MKNRLYRSFMIQSLLTLVLVTSIMFYYERKISNINNTNSQQMSSLKINDIKLTEEANTYKYLYDTQESSVKEYREKYNKVNDELTKLKTQIYISKQKEMNVSRGDYSSKNLSDYSIMTVDELNEWIKERAPEDSPFIGKADVFLKASADTNLDPKYLVAHAALESKWGKSNIAQSKNNYFGIGAFNATPTSSSYTFNTGLESGIIEGSEWIKQNYFNKGQTTLNGMIYGGPAYCQLSDGTPDQKWIDRITNIIYK